MTKRLNMNSALICCSAILLGSAVCSKPLSAEIVIFQGATVIDGTGAPPQTNVDLIVDGEKIIGLMPTGKASATNSRIVDCTGKSIIPGLISAHSHVGQVDGTSRVPENYTRDNILRQLRQYEVFGVTTIVSLGTNADLFYSIRKEAHAGTIPGADLFGADHGIGVVNGAPSSQVLPSAASQVDRPQTVEEAREAIRAAKERGTDLIKLWLDDGRGTVPKMNPEVYKAVIDEAHRQRLRVSAHIFNLADAKALVAAGVDIIAHGVRDQPVDQEFIDSMKSNNVWYIATLALDDAFFLFAERPELLEQPFFQNALQPALRKQFSDPEWRAQTLASAAALRGKESLRMNQRNLAMLHEAGVKIGFGTDSGAIPVRIPGFMEHRELELMVQSGISPLDVLTIATGTTAELLELKDRGTLAAKQLADFVILDANPADEILNSRSIHAVWHRGREVGGPVTQYSP